MLHGLTRERERELTPFDSLQRLHHVVTSTAGHMASGAPVPKVRKLAPQAVGSVMLSWLDGLQGKLLHMWFVMHVPVIGRLTRRPYRGFTACSGQ